MSLPPLPDAKLPYGINFIGNERGAKGLISTSGCAVEIDTTEELSGM